MPVLREEIEVARPLEEVWALVGDFANIAKWDPGVTDARKITKDPVTIGTSYELTIAADDNARPMIYEVTQFEPPHHIHLRGDGKMVSSSDDILLEATEGGTRIRYVADLRLKGWARMAESFLARRIRALGRDAIDGLRTASEAT